jgi:hypothetical protein
VRVLFFVFLFFECLQAPAQELAQEVTGKVEDRTIHMALAGATITLHASADTLVATSDELGVFKFERVPPGRYQLKVSFTGYQSIQQELLVISARKSEINVLLDELPSVLGEVEVSARSISTETGLQSITIEKTLRVPANFFDPVRVMTSYPGVMTANDQNNTLVVRGNSPAGLLWKVNGLDVVNPNHLANAGTFSDKPAAYGGGVNIISAQLIDRTDFYTGSIPPRYGNALSGIVDMKLREGNRDKFQYTAQASLIGLDAAAEGPLGENTSFLANYRYSTVGLLSAMGAKFGDEDIRFQDLTFSMSSKLSRERRLSVFGFYGASKNIFEHKDSLDWELDKDQYDIAYASQNFGAGFTLDKTIKRVHISSGIAVSGSDQERDQFASPQIEAGETDVIYRDRYDADKLLVSAFAKITANVNSNLLESGISVNYIKDEISIESQSGTSLAMSQSGAMDGYLIQPYAQWRMFLSDKWIAQTGMRYMYYTFNETGALEPRIAIEFLLNAKSSFKFSYNLVSQLQQAGTYMNENDALELTKSHHIDLNYTHQGENGFRFTSNAYFQKLWDIPVEGVSSSYSAINAIESWGLSDLVSDGTGQNFGVELLAEKSFYNQSYFIAGVSAYKSSYAGSDDVERATRFDGNYSVNLTYGKEWSKVKKESQRTFGVSSRLLYLGGLKESPVIDDPDSPGTLYDETRAFENKLQDYFRLDLRLNWRKNKKNYTRTIAIDIQNLFNVQNEAYHYYDHVKNKINTQYQLGLIPILVYRVEF